MISQHGNLTDIKHLSCGPSLQTTRKALFCSTMIPLKCMEAENLQKMMPYLNLNSFSP